MNLTEGFLRKIRENDPSVKYLYLSYPKKHDAEDLQALGDAIVGNDYIEYIGLSINAEDDDGAVAFLSRLQTCTNLKHLFLKSDTMGEAGVAAVASLLQTTHSLSNLQLAGKAFKPATQEFIFAALEQNRTLHTLQLFYAEIDESSATELVKAVTERKLDILLLHGCNVAPEALAHLGQINVRWIDLLRCVPELDVTAIQALAQTLKTNTVLSRLRLGIPSDNDALLAIAGVIKQNNTLETLGLDIRREENIEMSETVVHAFGEALQHNSTLKRLWLNHCRLSSRDNFKVLLDYLKHNNTLQELEIEDFEELGSVLGFLNSHYKIVECGYARQGIYTLLHRNKLLSRLLNETGLLETYDETGQVPIETLRDVLGKLHASEIDMSESEAYKLLVCIELVRPERAYKAVIKLHETSFQNTWLNGLADKLYKQAVLQLERDYDLIGPDRPRYFTQLFERPKNYSRMMAVLDNENSEFVKQARHSMPIILAQRSPEPQSWVAWMGMNREPEASPLVAGFLEAIKLLSAEKSAQLYTDLKKRVANLDDLIEKQCKPEVYQAFRDKCLGQDQPECAIQSASQRFFKDEEVHPADEGKDKDFGGPRVGFGKDEDDAL